MDKYVEKLKSNAIVRGPLFPERVQVILAVSMGESVKLIGKGLTSGKAYDPILSPAQIATLEITPELEPFDGDWFLVEEGAGNDARFWLLAQALSALYPASSEEKRWVDGVLARKKGLGF